MIRIMTLEDYDELYTLWKSIKGFGIRSVDDSKEGIQRFLQRNPKTSIVAVIDGKIVGSILCGHDGRTGYFYHVCVQEKYRMLGLAKQMTEQAIKSLKEEKICKVSLNALMSNEIGNAFWTEMGWKKRDDLRSYDCFLNEANIIIYNE